MKLLRLFCVLVSLSAVAKAQLLTGWGSSDFTLGYNDGTFSQNATSVTWSGSDLGMILRGTFTPVSLSSLPSSLTLDLTFNSTFSGQIDLTIGSSAGNVVGYNALLTNASGVSTLEFVRNVSLDSGSVNFGSITRVALVATSPNFTLNTLTAVPEPSTAVALAGLAAVGFAATRRRRRLG
jgi:hypothetical protein